MNPAKGFTPNKKTLEKFQKPIDKSLSLWYNKYIK